MKKFAFTLERMLGFKRTMYEKERSMLAQLRAEQAALQQRRDDTENQMLQLDAEFRHKAATEGVSIDEVTRVSFHRDNSDKVIKQFDIDIAKMEVAIAKQLEIVVALDKEVKSLEKLREQQWEEYQAQAAREETERILELVSRNFVDEQMAAAEEQRVARG